MAIPILGGILDDVIGGVTDIISEVVVDKDKKLEIGLELEKLKDRANERAHEEMIAQAATNTEEAKHRSIFVAGWRPFVGWGCGAALIYNTLVAPMIGTGQADLAFLQTILLGMLGIGAMRSFDKYNGTSNDVLRAPAPAPQPTPRGFPENLLPEDAPWTR